MDELWVLLFGLVKYTSLVDLVCLTMLFIIKYNDIRHLAIHNKISDSRRVKDGKMTLGAYYFAHKGERPLEI